MTQQEFFKICEVSGITDPEILGFMWAMGCALAYDEKEGAQDEE